jgi:glycosyltransferase involved in cell wall biosynthesis
MSLLVHPVIGDACPNVVSEALACGVPVIAPTMGGTAEIVGSGGMIFESNLWIYDQKFVEAMANTVESAMASLTMLSIQARQQAEEHLDIEDMVDKYLKALELPLNTEHVPMKSTENPSRNISVIKKWGTRSRYFASLIARKGSHLIYKFARPVHKPRPRIAFTLFDFHVGGIESWLFRLAKFLKNEFDFYFISTKVEEILPKYKNIGECAFLPDPVKMIRYLQRNYIDIIQVHNERWPIDAALAAGVPIIIERLGGPRSWLRVPKYGLDMVVASSWMAAEAVRGSIESSRIRVIYNGIDLNEIDLAPVNRLFPKDTFIIGRTSRFGRGQNLELLIEVIALMSNLHKNLRLVLVGSDSLVPGAQPVFQQLKALVQEKQVASSIIFTGNVAEPIPYIKGFDIGTCVSFDEGIPNSLIEAMACCKPVIATNVGAIHELIIDHQNGLLISPGNIAQLVNAIEQLVIDDDLYRRLAAAARETIDEKFNISTTASQYASLYHELLQ